MLSQPFLLFCPCFGLLLFWFITSLWPHHTGACLHICVSLCCQDCSPRLPLWPYHPSQASFLHFSSVFPFSFKTKTNKHWNKWNHLFVLTELTEIRWTTHLASFIQHHNIISCLCSTHDTSFHLLPSSLLLCVSITNGCVTLTHPNTLKFDPWKLHRA